MKLRTMILGAAVAAMVVLAVAVGSSAEKADAASVEVRCHDGYAISSLSNFWTWSQHKSHGDWEIKTASDRAACESGIPIPPLNSGYLVVCQDGGTEGQEVVLLPMVGFIAPQLAPNQVRITTLTQLAACQPDDE